MRCSGSSSGPSSTIRISWVRWGSNPLAPDLIPPIDKRPRPAAAILGRNAGPWHGRLLQATAFQSWRLCIARGGKSFTRYFSDKQCGGERKALKAAEAKLAELKAFLDTAPRKDGKLTRAAEAGARKVLGAGEGQ